MKNKLLLGALAISLIIIIGLACGATTGDGKLGNITNQRLLFPILDNVATSTSGVRVNVGDYRNIICAVDFDAVATMTVKFAGSLADEAPDFTSSASSSNQFDYVEVIDLEDGSAVDGDTGISVDNTTDHRMFEINTNRLNWFTSVVTSWTAGTTTVKCMATNNL